MNDMVGFAQPKFTGERDSIAVLFCMKARDMEGEGCCIGKKHTYTTQSQCHGRCAP